MLIYQTGVIPPYVVWPAFIAYILIVAYSMTSLITGVISESLIAARQEEETLRLQELEEHQKGLLKGLHRALAALDEDESGTLTHKEVVRAIEHHHEILPDLSVLSWHMLVRVSHCCFLEVMHRLFYGCVKLSYVYACLNIFPYSTHIDLSRFYRDMLHFLKQCSFLRGCYLAC